MKKLIMKLFTGVIIFASVLGPAASKAVTAQAAQSGWVYNSAQKAYNYYSTDGKKYTGWHYMTQKEGEKKDHWNYFGSDGRLYTGWQWMDAGEGEKTPHWSYFGANGWLRTGWAEMGKGTAEPDGNSSRHWSYFGVNGWLRTGLQNMGQGTSNPDGKAVAHKSYFGDNGWLVTNKTFTYSGVSYKADDRGWLSEVKQAADKSDISKNTNIVKYTVTFTDGNGKTLSTQTVEKGKSATPPVVPSRNGYTFKGWDKSFNNVNGNLIVCPIWTIKKYNVTFTDGQGNILKKETVKAGKNATAPSTPVRTGYKFAGWDKSYINITSDTKINAKWTKNNYTVTFTDGNGKTLSTQTVEEGKSATPPAEPARTGYTFKGWDKSYSNINGNLTINAKWEVHEHKWQAVYKTVHHEAVTHKEEKRTPTKSWWQQTNAIQIYGNLGSVSPAFYQVIMDDLTAVGLDYDDLYGIRDNVPAFRLLDELQADLYDYLNAFWQLYTVDDALYTKCLGYMYNEEETLDYLYSYSGKITELSKSIKRKIKQLQNIELGELTETGKLACETIYNKIDKITAQYKKLYNNGFPDPDGDGKRGHASADRNDHNQHTLYFNDYDFGLYVGYVLHQNAWRQATIDRPGWYNAVLVEDITVVDKEAWDEKVLDYYKCSCGQKKNKIKQCPSSIGRKPAPAILRR